MLLQSGTRTESDSQCGERLWREPLWCSQDRQTSMDEVKPSHHPWTKTPCIMCMIPFAPMTRTGPRISRGRNLGNMLITRGVAVGLRPCFFQLTLGALAMLAEWCVVRRCVRGVSRRECRVHRSPMPTRREIPIIPRLPTTIPPPPAAESPPLTASLCYDVRHRNSVDDAEEGKRKLSKNYQ